MYFYEKWRMSEDNFYVTPLPETTKVSLTIFSGALDITTRIEDEVEKLTSQ